MAATSNVGIDTTAGNFTYSSSISSTPKGLIKLGANILTLTGSNAYTGGTTIAAARSSSPRPLRFTARDGKLDRGEYHRGHRATLALNVGGSSDFTTGNVTTLLTNLDGGVTNDGLEAGLTIGFDTTNATLAVTLTKNITNTTSTGGGAVGVVKLGSGTLILSGANTYSGTTTVNAGTLAVNGSLFSSGQVTVSGGALERHGQRRQPRHPGRRGLVARLHRRRRNAYRRQLVPRFRRASSTTPSPRPPATAASSTSAAEPSPCLPAA